MFKFCGKNLKTNIKTSGTLFNKKGQMDYYNPFSTFVIKTERSALITHHLDTETVEFVKRVVCAEVDPLLIERPEIVVFGKPCRQNRNVGFFSDESIGYSYSGRVAASIPLPENLKKLLSNVNERFKTSYNGVLVNKYETGENSIGKHSDDEKALDEKGGVLVISSGSSRKFRIRDKTTDKIVADIITRDDEIMQMVGDFQKEFTHEIPVEKKVKGPPRFSFTFRKHTE